MVEREFEDAEKMGDSIVPDFSQSLAQKQSPRLGMMGKSPEAEKLKQEAANKDLQGMVQRIT